MAKKKQVTIEQLAEMVKRGFDEMGSKMATKQDLALLRDEVLRVGNDVHDMKITLGPLVRVVSAQEGELRNLRTRVDRLERKVGLGR